MTSIVIVVLGAVFVVLAAKNSPRHFKGQSACCGGTTVHKKRLPRPVAAKNTVHFWHEVSEVCGKNSTGAERNCRRLCKSQPQKGTASVQPDRTIDENELLAAVEHAGAYKVVSVI